MRSSSTARVGSSSRPSLRDLLGLAGDAVVVGARDHAEIWAPAAWDDYRKAMEAPDALAAHLTGLGI